MGRQVRVDGALVTLLAPEYEILRCLAAAAPEPCARLKLIEAMRLAEQQERSEKMAGDPLRRLHDYVRQLQARLGSAGRLIQPGGEGYRLARTREAGMKHTDDTDLEKPPAAAADPVLGPAVRALPLCPSITCR